MGIFSRREKKNIIDITDPNTYSFASVFGIGAIDAIHVTPRMAYLLAEKNGDLGKAIGDISGALATLTKGVKSGKDQIDYKHPLIQLLNKPGGGYNKIQFFKEISESFLLMNELYIIARGNINRPPLELEFIRPYDVTITQDSTKGEPVAIQTTSNKDRRIYKPTIIKGMTRYIDASGLNELLCIRGAVSLQDEWRGRSPITKLYYDIMLSNNGKRHNMSMLENGMRTSGIMSPAKSGSGEAPTTWGADKIKTLQEYIRTFAQGSGNAGNFLVVGTPTEIQGMTQSNKDMDFTVLLQNSQISIFNLYNVPLPLVLNTNMSYNNFTTANRTFYTKAVFPQFDLIAEGLMFNLRDRFGLTDDDTLAFDDTDIRDLQPVMIENMKMLNETQSVTKNEVRRLGGYEDIAGGDEVLILANQLPLSMVSNTDPNMFNEPAPANDTPPATGTDPIANIEDVTE
jgi:HK97 family phage portal protein